MPTGDFKRLRFSTRLAILLALATPPLAAYAGTPRGFVDHGKESPDMAPTGKGWGELRGTGGKEIANFPGNASAGKARTSSGGTTSNGINYRGGPVMTDPNGVNVYLIWYGNWSAHTRTQDLIKNFLANLGGTDYYKINTTYYYYDAVTPKRYVPNLVNLVDANWVATGSSTTLSDTDIQSFVIKNFQGYGSGTQTPDPNGVYFVLTAPDVTASSGFCTKYCGWHSYKMLGTTPVKYSFVGNPAQQCPTSCGAQSVTPNGDVGGDSMVSVIAHELEEAVTDPQLNAWYDSRGYENADKCAWTFGTVKTAANGSKYNMTLNGINYLIQQNWVNAGGGSCKMAY